MNLKFTALLFSFCCLMSTSSLAQAFWTEDFSSQSDFQTEWTNGGTNGGGGEEWSWSDDPSLILFGSQPPFASATVDNGYILFNSDANGNASHSVTITSSAIDCSGQNTVFIRCENQYSYFSSDGSSVAQIGVSTNGVDFVYYDILVDVAPNDLTDAVQVVFLEIPEAANQPQVFIQFKWDGFFEYTWKIDDVSLESSDPTPPNELVIDSVAIAPNFSMPLSQIDTIEFLNVIENKGSDTQNNVITMVEIIGDNGESFNTTSTTVSSVDPNGNVRSEFTETFAPTMEGNYTLTYTVDQDEADLAPANNVNTSEFAITSNLFSKDNGIVSSATQPQDINGTTWDIGNYYVIYNEGYRATTASFSVASENDIHQGQTVGINLYRINDDATAPIDDDDLSVVGFAQHEFTTEESFDLITVDILNVLDLSPGVELLAGEYLLMITYTPDMACPFSDLAYYWDIATVVHDGDWFLGGFGPDVTAVARMTIEPLVNTTEAELLESAQIQLTPNPASEFVDVNIQLEDITEEMVVRIIDMSGKSLLSQQITNTQQANLQFNVSELASGSYLVHVQTTEGYRAERLIIQR